MKTKSFAQTPNGVGGTPNSNQPCELSRKQFQITTPPNQNQQFRAVELLTRRQVAKRWACCQHTVARRKDLKPVRFNKRLLRYRLVDIEAIEAAAIA